MLYHMGLASRSRRWRRRSSTQKWLARGRMASCSQAGAHHAPTSAARPLKERENTNPQLGRNTGRDQNQRSLPRRKPDFEGSISSSIDQTLITAGPVRKSRLAAGIWMPPIAISRRARQQLRHSLVLAFDRWPSLLS